MDPINPKKDKRAERLRQVLQNVPRPPTTQEEALVVAVAVLRDTVQVLSERWPEGAGDYAAAKAKYTPLTVQIKEAKQQLRANKAHARVLQKEYEQTNDPQRERELKREDAQLKQEEDRLVATLRKLKDERKPFKATMTLLRSRFHYFGQLQEALSEVERFVQIVPQAPEPEPEPEPERPPPRLHLEQEWRSRSVQTLTKGPTGYTRALLAAFQDAFRNTSKSPEALAGNADGVLLALLQEADALAYAWENPKPDDDDHDPTLSTLMLFKMAGKALLPGLSQVRDRTPFWEAFLRAAESLPVEDEPIVSTPPVVQVRPPSPPRQEPAPEPQPVPAEPPRWTEPRLRALLEDRDTGLSARVVTAFADTLRQFSMAVPEDVEGEAVSVLAEIQKLLPTMEPEKRLSSVHMFAALPQGHPYRKPDFWVAFLGRLRAPAVPSPAVVVVVEPPAPQAPQPVTEAGWQDPRLAKLMEDTPSVVAWFAKAASITPKVPKPADAASAALALFRKMDPLLKATLPEQPLDASVLFLATPSSSGYRERKFWDNFMRLKNGEPVEGPPKRVRSKKRVQPEPEPEEASSGIESDPEDAPMWTDKRFNDLFGSTSRIPSRVQNAYDAAFEAAGLNAEEQYIEADEVLGDVQEFLEKDAPGQRLTPELLTRGAFETGHAEFTLKFWQKFLDLLKPKIPGAVAPRMEPRPRPDEDDDAGNDDDEAGAGPKPAVQPSSKKKSKSTAAPERAPRAGDQTLSITLSNVGLPITATFGTLAWSPAEPIAFVVDGPREVVQALTQTTVPQHLGVAPAALRVEYPGPLTEEFHEAVTREQVPEGKVCHMTGVREAGGGGGNPKRGKKAPPMKEVWEEAEEGREASMKKVPMWPESDDSSEVRTRETQAKPGQVIYSNKMRFAEEHFDPKRKEPKIMGPTSWIAFADEWAQTGIALGLKRLGTPQHDMLPLRDVHGREFTGVLSEVPISLTAPVTSANGKTIGVLTLYEFHDSDHTHVVTVAVYQRAVQSRKKKSGEADEGEAQPGIRFKMRELAGIFITPFRAQPIVQAPRPRPQPVVSDDDEDLAAFRALPPAPSSSQKAPKSSSSDAEDLAKFRKIEPTRPSPPKRQPAPDVIVLDEDDNANDAFVEAVRPRPEEVREEPVRKQPVATTPKERALAFLNEYGGIRVLQSRAALLKVRSARNNASVSASGAILLFQTWLTEQWFAPQRRRTTGPTLDDIMSAVVADELPPLALSDSGGSFWREMFRNKLTQKRIGQAASVCGACGAPEPAYRCTHCREVRYCGQECADAHWEAHTNDK